MSTYKSDFLNVLNERGFIHQCSDFDGLDALLKKETVTAYVGYDATATSLHIGNLISVTMLYWLQETGHRPVTLMGGGTSMVGDPSFRDDQRKLLTPEQIEQNIEGIKKIFGRIMRYGDGPTDAMMVNNADWLRKTNLLDFLREDVKRLQGQVAGSEQEKLAAHLKGYDPKKAPTFGWPARSVAWYARFKDGKETLAPDHAVELELISPESENWRSPRTPHETQIYISNASSRAIALEWIDFDGTPKTYGVELRPTDHTQQHTYAGHVWRLIDDKTKKPLHYFIAPKKPGKLIYKDR